METKAYIHQFGADTGCSLKDLPRAMAKAIFDHDDDDDDGDELLETI